MDRWLNKIKSLGCYPLLVFAILLNFLTPSYSNAQFGHLKGTIIDGSDNSRLSNVLIYKDQKLRLDSSKPDGQYSLRMISGIHTVHFSYPGYRTVTVKDIRVVSNQVTDLTVVLLPVAKQDTKRKRVVTDSSRSTEKEITVSFQDIRKSYLYNPLFRSGRTDYSLKGASISIKNFKDPAAVLDQLPGLISYQDPSSRWLNRYGVNGMGSRYTTYYLNNSPLPSMGQFKNSFPVELTAPELVDNVSMNEQTNSFQNGTVTGGAIHMNTKESFTTDFLQIQLGAGFSEETLGKPFLSDTRNSSQALSFPGKLRNLPKGFPTTRSEVLYHQRNLQNQNDLAKLLPNNLGPVNFGNSGPDSKATLLFGKNYKEKKGLRVSLIGQVGFQKEQRIDNSESQLLPDMENNSFPFIAGTRLIRSQSTDQIYRYHSQATAMIGLSFLFRKNKISIRNFAGNSFENSYTRRTNVNKPDEDSLASDGVRYLTEQNKYLITQINGEHTLGEKGKLSLDWQVTYQYNEKDKPDERNILLRQSGQNPDLFKIAIPQSPPLNRTQLDPGNINPTVNFSQQSNFINSSRLWSSSFQNSLTAAVNMRIPVNLFNSPQIISGGLFMQNNNLKSLNDLYLVNGGDFTSLSNILSEFNYFPGGLSITNYYSTIDRISGKAPNFINNANYIGNQNIGASYVAFETKLPRNVQLNWGFRLESANLTSTIVQYEFVQGFKNPQKFSIDDNVNQVFFNVLPSFRLSWAPLPQFRLYASYNRSVNRPMHEELNRNFQYETSNFLIKTGNPNLRPALIDNYSLNFLLLSRNSSSLQISAFQRNIDQPIEYVVVPYLSGNLQSIPYNMPSATIKGIQATLNWSLASVTESSILSTLSLMGSGQLTTSKVAEGPVRNASIGTIREHELSETPRSSLNAALRFQSKNLPSLTLTYNWTSDFISKVGSGKTVKLANGNNVLTTPQYYVKGLRQLNIQAGYSMFKNKLTLVAGVTNLLADPFVEYQDLNGNKKMDAPILLDQNSNTKGIYLSGTDNTVQHITTQRNFYLRLSLALK